MLSRDVGTNVSCLGFVKHPPLVLGVVRVFTTEIVPDDLPGSLLIEITELSSEFGRIICSHDTECRPWAGGARG